MVGITDNYRQYSLQPDPELIERAGQSAADNLEECDTLCDLFYKQYNDICIEFVHFFDFSAELPHLGVNELGFYDWESFRNYLKKKYPESDKKMHKKAQGLCQILKKMRTVSDSCQPRSRVPSKVNLLPATEFQEFIKKEAEKIEQQTQLFVEFLKKQKVREELPENRLQRLFDDYLGTGVCEGASIDIARKKIAVPSTKDTIMPNAQARFLQAAFAIEKMCILNGLHIVSAEQSALPKESQAWLELSQQRVKLWTKLNSSLASGLMKKLHLSSTRIIMITRDAIPTPQPLAMSQFIDEGLDSLLSCRESDHAVINLTVSDDALDTQIDRSELENELYQRMLKLTAFKSASNPFEALKMCTLETRKEIVKTFKEKHMKEFISAMAVKRVGLAAPHAVIKKVEAELFIEVEVYLQGIESASKEVFAGKSRSGHAVYCKFAPPYELHDVNFPEFDLRTEDLKEFKFYIGLWWAFSGCESVISIEYFSAT